MTPQERYEEIDRECAPVTYRGIPIKPYVSSTHTRYLLARVRRAEELLRDIAVVYMAHYMSRDADEIRAFLAGEGE